jgi:hypothetical protein
VKQGIVVCCIAILAAPVLVGCATIATQQAAKNVAACAQEAKTSPEGQLVYARLWAFDDSDTATKLRDPAPLTKEQQNALVQFTTRSSNVERLLCLTTGDMLHGRRSIGRNTSSEVTQSFTSWQAAKFP